MTSESPQVESKLSAKIKEIKAAREAARQASVSKSSGQLLQASVLEQYAWVPLLSAHRLPDEEGLQCIYAFDQVSACPLAAL